MRFNDFEIQENPERRLFNANFRVLEDEITPDQVDAMAFATAKALGIKDPVIDQEVVHKLRTEGIHINNF